jgi:hypothetical protein
MVVGNGAPATRPAVRDDARDEENAMLRVKRVCQTSPACPAQWEGWTDDGRPLYVRYRFGRLSVRVGPVGGDMDSAVEGEEVFFLEHGNDLDGWMDYDELCRLTAGKVRFPYEVTEDHSNLYEHKFIRQPDEEEMVFLTLDRGFKADPRVVDMLERVASGEEKLYELQSFSREHRN